MNRRFAAAVGIWVIAQSVASAAMGDLRESVFTPGSLQHSTLLESLSAAYSPATPPIMSTSGLSGGGKFLAVAQPFVQSVLPVASAAEVQAESIGPSKDHQTNSVLLYAMGALAVLFALKRRAPRRY